MSIISTLVVLVILGLALYLVENYVPMSPPFKVALRVVAVLLLVLWLLQSVGIWTGWSVTTMRLVFAERFGPSELA